MIEGVTIEIRRKRKVFFEKIRYEDDLARRKVQQPFPGNGARKLVGYFNDANKSASVRIPL